MLVTPDRGGNDSDEEDDLKLDPTTLCHLNDFLAVKQEQRELFDQLNQAAGQPDQHWSISIDQFKHIFSENWQLSQFWYSTAFAERLARMIEASLPELAASKPTVAFMCSPTAFVALLATCPGITDRCNPVLMEYDARFAALPGRFVKYDLDEPEEIPEDLVRSVDVAVIDPPFLNLKTNINLCKTLKKVFRGNNIRQLSSPISTSDPGRVILLSSAGPGMSEDDLVQAYNDVLSDLNPSGTTTMKELPIQVEHDGGRLANDFKCWANWDSLPQ